MIIGLCLESDLLSPSLSPSLSLTHTLTSLLHHCPFSHSHLFSLSLSRPPPSLFPPAPLLPGPNRHSHCAKVPKYIPLSRAYRAGGGNIPWAVPRSFGNAHARDPRQCCMVWSIRDVLPSDDSRRKEAIGSAPRICRCCRGDGRSIVLDSFLPGRCRQVKHANR
jgi:hypothetical protein